MTLLDSNIVSEVMKAQPAEADVAWLNGEDSTNLNVSAITIGEIAYGLRILPDGKRRSGRRERFEQLIALAFDQRVLTYDEAAARIYGELMGGVRSPYLMARLPQSLGATISRWRPGTFSASNIAA